MFLGKILFARKFAVRGGQKGWKTQQLSEITHRIRQYKMTVPKKKKCTLKSANETNLRTFASSNLYDIAVVSEKYTVTVKFLTRKTDL